MYLPVNFCFTLAGRFLCGTLVQKAAGDAMVSVKRRKLAFFSHQSFSLQSSFSNYNFYSSFLSFSLSSFLLIFYEYFTFHLLLSLVFLVRPLAILQFLFLNFFLFSLFLRIAFHDILHVFYFLSVDTSCQDGDPYVCPWWSVADRNSGKCSFTWRQGWTRYSLASEQ